MVKKQDNIYRTPLGKIVDFEFDEKVAAVFPDMLQRSVPGYGLMIANIGILAGRYARPGSRCYDLGCSLGAATLSMRHRIAVEDCTIVAVDNSAAMLERARELLDSDESSVPVELVCSDIRDIEIVDASVVVLNLTLQFIPPNERLALLTRICDGLQPGGLLVLSEKIAFEDPGRQALQDELHHEFKRAQGYSELEISQKRTALENVMRPESLAMHEERLKAAGFATVEPWFQCFNFASMVAIK